MGLLSRFKCLGLPFTKAVTFLVAQVISNEKFSTFAIISAV